MTAERNPIASIVANSLMPYGACFVGNSNRGVLDTRTNLERVNGQTIRFKSGFVWTRKYLNPQRKSCGLKISGYVWTGPQSACAGRHTRLSKNDSCTSDRNSKK